MMVGLLLIGVFLILILNFNFISFYLIIYPLFDIAAKYGHKEVVEFLASKGADIHEKKNDGSTALMSGIFNFYKNLFHFIK